MEKKPIYGPVITYKSREVRTKDYFRAIATNMQELMNEAALAYLIAAIKKVPLWSGQSRATFIPMFSKLGDVRTTFEVLNGSPRQYGERWNKKRTAMIKYKIPNRVSQGKRNSRSSKVRSNATFTFSFSFNHVALNERGQNYFAMNDSTNMSDSGIHLKHPTPWGATEAGIAASNTFVKSNYRRFIPNINNYIRTVNRRNTY